MYDVTIIGAGVIGAFIARELAKYDLKIALIDKENDVGNVTSMANSAIVHSGYDPLPHTMKAKFNVLGNKMYQKTCEELDVKFIRTGSMTVATTSEHLKTLQELEKRAHINGVKVRLLNEQEAKALEPNLHDSVIGALYCETAGVVDPFNLVVHAVENAIDNGVKLLLNHEVLNIEDKKECYKIVTNRGNIKTKYIINASGINGDKISDMVTPHYFDIKARKGEYFVLDHFDDNFLSMPIFPLPSEKGKGILMTPTTSHNYLVGPSSEFVDDKDDLSTDSYTLSQIKEQASLIMKNIPFNYTIRVFAGNRPTPSTHDFIIEKVNDRFVNAVGIESPGLVSAPAIGQYVADEIIPSMMKLKKKENYVREVKRYVRPKELSSEERDELIRHNPKYGHLVCRCEFVSEQEIIDVLNRSCPPHSFKALKKRVRTGLGRCQGGMCQPNIVKLLAKHYKVNINEINYDNLDTLITKAAVKGGEGNE